MSTTTTNLGLKKPTVAESFNIEDFNGNADIIDAAIGSSESYDFSITGLSSTGTGSISKVIKNGANCFMSVGNVATSAAINDWDKLTSGLNTLSQNHKLFGASQIVVLPVAAAGGIVGNLFVKAGTDGAVTDAWWRVSTAIAVGTEITISAGWIAG